MDDPTSSSDLNHSFTVEVGCQAVSKAILLILLFTVPLGRYIKRSLSINLAMKSKVFNDTHHFLLVSRVYVCFRISKLPLVSITVFNSVRSLLNLDSKIRFCGHNSR